MKEDAEEISGPEEGQPQHDQAQRWLTTIVSAFKSAGTSEKEFRRMTVTIFGILLSVAVMWLVYFNYLMFGDFFSGAFLAVLTSIPLEIQKRQIIQELGNRVRSANVSVLKSARNGLLFQFFSLAMASGHFLVNHTGTPFREKVKLIRGNVYQLLKQGCRRIVDDTFFFLLIVSLYIWVTRSFSLSSGVLITFFAVGDILIRLLIDLAYAVLRQIHCRLFTLYEEDGKPVTLVRSAVSGILILCTILGILVFIGVFVLLILLEISQLQEFGMYIYGLLEQLLKQSKVLESLIYGSDGFVQSVRLFAQEYGAQVQAGLDLPLNLTALVNGTKDEVQKEFIRGTTMLINGTFALDTAAIYEIVQDSINATTGGVLSVGGLYSIFVSNAAKVG